MSFKNNLITDLDIFLNSNEFAVDVTYQAATIKGIFDAPFKSAVEGEMGIESTLPQVLVKTGDVPSAEHGQTMTIDSVVYQIIGIQPDGTGMTTILLSED